jgi:hypothetical protein
MHATEWAAVGSAAFAAVAAGASWSSVWQNRRERLAAQRPELLIEVSVGFPSNKIVAQIHNNGGTARIVRFCVIEGTFMAYGTPHPTGIFQSGESRTIETALPSTEDRSAKAWVSGVDPGARHVYVTTSKGDQKRYRLKWPHTNVSDARFTEDFYGVAADRLSLVSHETTDRQL